MTAAKITYDYFGIKPSFSTATELRDALLAAYPDAEFFRGPITGVRVGYDIDAAPAWGWLKQLLRTRTDWWPAVGIAVQHAARDGGELAQQALADLIATCEESAVLLEWTEPVAAKWPDTRTSGSTGCNVPDGRLDDLVARQRARLAERQSAPIRIPGLPDGDAKTAEDLESLLAISIEEITHGPWYWLVSELVDHPWMRPLMPAICEKFSTRNNRDVRAMLDWLFEEHDLWRHFELLDEWSQHQPAWWNESLKPGRGYRNPLRMEIVGEAKILGHLVWRARRCAVVQRETPPIMDLAPNPSLDGPPRVPLISRPSSPPSPSGASSSASSSAPSPPPPAAPPSSSASSPSPSSPTSASSPPTLGSGSLAGDGFRAPTPALTFAQHRAAIVQLLVLDQTRVASVDRDRVALIWNPQTAAVVSSNQLPPNAIAYSLSSTHQGLAYVVQDADGLAVHALDDHRVLARVSRRDLPISTIAHCRGDLSRVLLASDGALVLVSLAGDAPLVRTTVETHEPDVLAIDPCGDNYLVRFFHVGMDMYPTDDEATFDGSTLRELDRRRGSIDVRSPLSSPPSARVEISGELARVFVDGRPLPDLVAHANAICLSAWIGNALWTADSGGTMHGWDVAHMVVAPRVPAQHAGAVTDVRFTSTGVVSFTAKETKLWRDQALVATMPAINAPIIDEEAERLGDVDANVRTYSLVDGASLGTFGAASNHAFGSRVIGPRGLITVRVQDSHPIRVVSMRDDHDAIRERMLPTSLDEILSQSAPPIVHAGRLLLSHYTEPTRSISFDTFAVQAQRHLHVGGTSWTALHPDGTLYSAGYVDGDVASSDVLTLTERARWSIFNEGSDAERAIHAAVLLPRRARILIAGHGRIRRFELDPSMFARVFRDPVDLALVERAEELVANAAESRVVVFLTTGAAKVIDVDQMTWVDARSGEIEAARARRRRSLQSEAHGFAHAFACDGGRWLVGWSFGLSVTTFSAGKGTLRAPFSTLIVPKHDTLRGSLVDDTRDELWLLCKDGTLARTSLVRDEPFETVTTIAGGVQLSWASRSTFALQTETGALHVLRTTGERICTIEDFMPSRYASHALAESVAVCSQPDGALRVAALPGDSYITLRDARAIVGSSAIAIAGPFVASRHGNQVLRWDLRTRECTGAWTASTTLTAIDVREDGAVLAGEANGVVTVLR